MSKASTRTKMKWNRATYRRYEFNLRIDSKLNALVERYKTTPGANLSELLKGLLRDYFGIGPDEADEFYAPYYYDSAHGWEKIQNTELDKFFQ